MGKEVESLNEYMEVGKEIVSYGAELVIISYKFKHDLIFTPEGAWILTIEQGELDESHLLGTGDAYVAAMIHDYLTTNHSL
jgi:1-phosphofructokinase